MLLISPLTSRKEPASDEEPEESVIYYDATDNEDGKEESVLFYDDSDNSAPEDSLLYYDDAEGGGGLQQPAPDTQTIPQQQSSTQLLMEFPSTTTHGPRLSIPTVEHGR